MTLRHSGATLALLRAWADRAYKRARRHGLAAYQPPAPAVLPVTGEFTLPLAPTPAQPVSGNGNGHRDGNGRPGIAAFPWGGEDR